MFHNLDYFFKLRRILLIPNTSSVEINCEYIFLQMKYLCGKKPTKKDKNIPYFHLSLNVYLKF